MTYTDEVETVILPFDGTYTGALIADQTNPWVVVGGQMVDWLTVSSVVVPPVFSGCGTCSGTPMVGVLAPIDTEFGVQRCDECDIFAGDLDAALALAALVGGTVWFESEVR